MSWIKQARWIVEHSQCKRLDPDTGEFTARTGVLLDLFSASAMVQIYDGLNDENQAKFGGMPVLEAHHVTFQLLEDERR